MQRLYAVVPLLMVSGLALAQAQPARNLPTLSEYGLYGLVALVGAVGAWIVKRSSK